PVFSTPGSRLALVAGGPGVEVKADLASFTPADVPSDVALGEVSIRGSVISASLPAGSVLVRGGSMRMEGSSISVNHDGIQPNPFENAVDIAVRGDLSILTQSNVTAISSGTLATGTNPAGTLRLRADTIEIAGSSEVLTTASG